MNRGFVDLQVNGYMGISFSAPGLTAEKIKSVTRKMVERGTSAYCATIVTSPMEVYRANLPVIADAIEDPELGQHILGIHLEGPFISSVDGARGMHNAKFVMAPDIKVYEELQKLASGKVVIVTLAPELKGSTSLIRHITGKGNVTVSIGHHMGGKENIELAVRAGARASTHLGNGIPEMLRRHTNPIWVQLAEDSLTGMFITDGHHLPPEFIKTALRAKTPERFIVTSDVSPVGGMPPGTYEVEGMQVVVEENGRIRCATSSTLGGSSANMMQCMNVLASLGELSETELWKVGYENPLKLIDKEDFVPPAFHGIEFIGGKFTKSSSN